MIDKKILIKKDNRKKITITRIMIKVGIKIKF
jgi:hypothetical protein